ncbi:hypothetical protein K933_16557 [Candidatus Halobonum tyrrellensis G22]|uniref:Type I phosphodiesterase/nucleotide pyrophosphatase n=1 Tax=Candidatus Halobonum tyrrellensis G22 TaxID=1324957 RepID=V4GND1_9EURY|nr:hypothetical protein K933_16557 [Candidatus Halobonum tyrrellensis G22]
MVVGFDALDFEYLDRFDLPAFDTLRSDGVEAPLSSTFPPWTGSAWPSTYTGSTPDHHGAFSFFDFADHTPADAPILSRNEVRLPAIWDYLTARGASSIVVNVPVTHPADEIEGVLVPGYLAPEREPSHPSGVRSEISEAIGREYRIYSETETDSGAEAVDKLDSYVDLIRSRGEAAEYLLDAYDWEFAFVQVQKTDAVFHEFTEESAFERVYRAADEVLDTVRSAAPDANVVVCSDHGIGPVTGSQVAVNEILRREGFLESAPDGELPSLSDRKKTLDVTVNGNERTRGRPSVAARAASTAESVLRTAGLTPDDVYAVTKRLGVDEQVRRLLPEDVLDSARQGVDWGESRAYCRLAPELGVRLNVEGRDPEGVVPPDEYEATRDAIVDLLAGVTARDGDPVFEWVEPREAVYDGPAAEDACDVLFYPREMNHVVTTRVGGRPVNSADTYNHKQNGVFVAAGPSFAEASADAVPSPMSLTSVAPVALAASGYPVPERMTGEVPAGLGVPATRERYGNVSFAGGAADDDEGDVRDRLSDLGYL